MNISQGLWSPFNNKCAKRVVTAILIPKDTAEWPHHFIGQNYCNNAQDVCPREEGEGYLKCKTICEQESHAEIDALQKAGNKAKGSTIVVVGHDHCCKNCLDAMQVAGVAEVIIL